jgi:hypothetical protein
MAQISSNTKFRDNKHPILKSTKMRDIIPIDKGHQNINNIYKKDLGDYRTEGITSQRTLDDLTLHLLRVQIGFAPLVIILYFLNLDELLIHLFKMLISYSFSFAFMKEFSPYLQKILISHLPQNPMKLNEYILSLLFSLLTFLVVELTIDKNFYILFILILLILLCGYVIHSILDKASPRYTK